jgi:hypothetical protein
MGEEAHPEFFLMWQRLANFHVALDREDVLLWRWSGDGCYSAKSAYGAFFSGQEKATISEEIWHSRPPYRCKFFAWLVSKNRCWTADGLQRRGLPYASAFPLCDQDPKTLQHPLLGCVVVREVWAWTLRRWDKLEWLPKADSELLEWWTSRSCPAAHEQDMSLLSSWFSGASGGTGTNMVFNGAMASQSAIRKKITEEFNRWRLAKLFRGMLSVSYETSVLPWQHEEYA